MKKRMVILSVVAAVCLVGVVLIVCKLRSLGRKVTFEPMTEEGSAAAADGLRISYMQYAMTYGSDDGWYYEGNADRVGDRQWRHTLSFGRDGLETKSEIVRDTKRLLEKEKEWKEEENFLFEARSRYDYYSSSGVLSENFFAEDELSELQKSGTRKIIKLTDYEPYYRMADGFDSYLSFIRHYFGYPGCISDPDEKLIRDRFNAFFRIPILEQEVWSIGYEKDPDYDYYNFTCDITENGDFYTPSFNGIISHDSVYFTFGTHSENGAVMDTSLIPGGYGIYVLPYRLDHEEKKATVMIDDMRVVAPLDPDIRVSMVELSRDESLLMLLYIKNEEYRVRIYDTLTWTCQSDTSLASGVKKNWFESVNIGDDFFVVDVLPRLSSLIPGYHDIPDEERKEILKAARAAQREKSVLGVFGRAADGSCGELMRTAGSTEYTGIGVHCAFDGERLACVADFRDYIAIDVFTKDGNVYRGTWRQSLSTAIKASQEIDEEKAYAIESANIEVSWEK